MSGFNLSELNFSGVQLNSGGGFLSPGRYVVKTSEARLVPLRDDGSMKLEVRLTDVDQGSSVRISLNVFNRNSQKNTEIAQKDLYSLIVYGGHPGAAQANPLQFTGVNGLNGLTVGVILKAGNAYVDKNGIERTPSELSAFVDPSEIDPATYTPRPIPVKGAAAPAGDFHGVPF